MWALPGDIQFFIAFSHIGEDKLVIAFLGTDLHFMSQLTSDFVKKFIEQFPPTKAQSTKIGCAFSLSAPYSEERRKTASEAAKKYGVHRKVAHLYGDRN